MDSIKVLRGAGAALLVLLLSAAAVLLGGCGGSDGSEELTKAELIKQGDAICSQTDKTQYAALEKASKEFQQASIGRKGQEALVRKALLPTLHQEAEELAELTPPEADQKQYEAILQAIEGSLAKIEKNLSLLEEQTHGDPFGEADQLAKQYGFKDCSEVI